MPRLKTRQGRTREAIIAAGEAVVREGGFGSFTFEAVAQRLGVSKQAVIYWFPSKQDLVRAMAIPAIRGEADATIQALEDASDAGDAVERFVRALAGFHLADLPRFRLMYLAVQVGPREGIVMPPEMMAEHVHPVTGRMYAALEAKLAGDPKFPADLHPRRTAAAVHMAGLGLLAMAALGEAVEDPLAHSSADLVHALVAVLRRGVGRY